MIWLLRKHPPHPYQHAFGLGHLKAFTIAGVFANRADAANAARKKNLRSNYLYTVAKLKLPEQSND